MTMNPRDAATAKGCIDSMISLSQNLARVCRLSIRLSVTISPRRCRLRGMGRRRP
jgi:hypothetical protein